MHTQSFHFQTPLFQGFSLPKRKHEEELWVSSRTEVLEFGAVSPSQMLHGFAHTRNRLELSELYVYGSGRLGNLEQNLVLHAGAEQQAVWNPFIEDPSHQTDSLLDEHESIAYTPDVYTISATHKSFTAGQKRYEISNHLGNVTSVITDRKFGVPVNGTDPTISYYLADIVSTTDYDPYGQALPGRVWNRTGYRFGFNGQEFDSELGEIWSAEFWEYDASLGRRWDIDPIDLPWQSPYAAFSCNPVYFSDPLGLMSAPTNNEKSKGGNGPKRISKGPSKVNTGPKGDKSPDKPEVRNIAINSNKVPKEPEQVGWYKAKDGSIQYMPQPHLINRTISEIVMNSGIKANGSVSMEGAKFIGLTFSEKTSTGGNALYKSDGSILYSNESDALNRIWENANRTHKEHVALLGGEKGTLVLPIYYNHGAASYDTKYGYNYKNSGDKTTINKGNFSLEIEGSVHTHQEDMGGFGHSAADESHFSFYTPGKVCWVMENNGIMYGKIFNKKIEPQEVQPIKIRNVLNKNLPYGYKTLHNLSKALNKAARK